MRMSNEQRQSRSGRKVTLAVICLKNICLYAISGYLPTTCSFSLPDDISYLCPDLFLLLDCFLNHLSFHLFTLNSELPPVSIQGHSILPGLQGETHLSKTSLVSTLLSTTTSFFTLPSINQSLICARMSLRNFCTYNI